MANILTNLPPLKVATEVEPLYSFREMHGLAIILGNVPDEAPLAQNTSESINQLKNHMGWAQALTWNDWSRVAKVPDGKKFASSSTRTNIFRGDGTSSVSSNRKPYILDQEGYVHVMLGNDSVNWREDLYDSISFANGIPNYKGPGIHKTQDGWYYATVSKGFDGAHDDRTSGYFAIENYEDAYREIKALNRKDEISQAKRICGTGKTQTTGTCCLYYNDSHYDTVAGITMAPGDYYKCMCAKCYECLELARDLNKDYVFNSFTGTGPTGGTGARCIDCDLENPPSNCGPCACSIGTDKKYNVLLKDSNIPNGSKSKENARMGKYWNESGAGSVLLHVTGNVINTNHTEREISQTYWGADKVLVLEGPQISTGETKYSIVTETDGRGKEYFVGIKLISIGTYTSKPLISSIEDEFKKICPNLNATQLFTVVMLPDFSQISEISELVGGTQTQLNVKVNIADISNKETGTLLDDFNTYSLGVPVDSSNVPIFASKDNIKTTKRLTYQNEDITITSSSGGGIPLSKAQTQARKVRNDQVKNRNRNRYTILAGQKPKTSTTARLEVFAGRDEKTATNIESSGGNGLIDKFSTRYSTTSTQQKLWKKPTSTQTGELLDIEKTNILHVNSIDLKIPSFDETKEKVTNVSGFNNISIQFVLTIGTS